MQRLRILISAHELSPSQGSECAEGWNLVTRIARYHNVTVLYARGSQFAPDAYEKAVSEWIAEHGNEHNIEFIAVPQPKTTLWLASINKRISKKGSSIGLPFLYSIGYNLWQKRAYKVATSSFLLSPFSLIHHLTSIHFREPGYLWKLPIPFVWGPTGGTLTIPPAFYRHIGLKQTVFEIGRSVSNALLLNWGRRVNQAIKKSTLILAFSEEDQKVFQAREAKRVEVMLDAGCEIEDQGTKRPRDQETIFPSLSPSVSRSLSLHVLWVGQLIRRKALNILLKAVAGDEDLRNNVKITVIGDGPLRSYYEKLAHELFSVTRHSSLVTSSQSRITFLGQLPRTAVFDHMRHADVLVHTSYREATSNVIPEALSCGLPVICHDISGMAVAITDECGIKIPLETYKESVAGFRNALKNLLPASPNLNHTLTTPHHTSPPLNHTLTTPHLTSPLLNHTSPYLTNLKSGALRRAEQLSWDSMASRIAQDYARIADQS